ncbi:MAG: hypothetical protein GXP62_13110, partial [Oligoflexia bacterium]|nr:hypothetical protein [Oligoflexia bacterium]
MSADLTGFTRLCAALQDAGPSGVERLAEVLDRCLGRLVECVQRSGGDVIHFAGDAVVAVWVAPDSALLKMQLQRALACALRSQQALDGWIAYPDHTLHLRIGLGAGPLSVLDLRAGDGHRRCVAAGPAMRQVSQAERLAPPGSTVLSAQAAAMLTLPPGATALAEGAVCLDARCATAVLKYAPPPTSQPPLDLSAPNLADRLRPYIPQGVLNRMSAGHTEWMAELRTVTAVFLCYPTLDPHASQQHDLTKDLANHAGQALARTGGTLDNLLVDVDGTTLVMAFGLPPGAHQDDALRAVSVALELVEAARDRDLHYQVGIST